MTNAVPTLAEQNIRIPNLPLGPYIDNNGMPYMEFLTFLQTLTSNLQNYFGDEGLVAPSQTAANVLIIQNDTNPNPSGGAPIYNCEFGTILYESDTRKMKVAINDGTGKPIFKEINLI